MKRSSTETGSAAAAAAFDLGGIGGCGRRAVAGRAAVGDLGVGRRGQSTRGRGVGRQGLGRSGQLGPWAFVDQTSECKVTGFKPG